MTQFLTQTRLRKVFFILGLSCFSIIGNAQNVAINSTGAAPNASALLDLAASNKGLLVPRVALSVTTSNSPIGASITTSLLVYNTATVSDVTPGYYYWDGSKWLQLSTGSSATGWGLTGNAGTTPTTNFIGTTDAQDFVTKTNNTERMRVLSTGEIEVAGNTNSGKLFHIKGTNGTTEDVVLEDAGGTYSYLHMVIRNTTGTGSMSYSFSKQGGNSHFAGIDFDPDYDGLVIRNNARLGGNTGTRDGFITFVTNDGSSTERMRINTNGNIGVGNFGGSAGADANVRSGLHLQKGGFSIGVSGSNGISTTHGAKNSIQLNTDTYYGGVHDEHSGALIYAANMNGWTTAKLDICISNNWGTYNTASPALRIGQTTVTMNGTTITSDRRLKTNIKKLNYGLKDLMKVTPVSYDKHIAKEIKKGKVVLEEKGEHRIGFIAQDLYQIIPELVNKPKNEDEEFWSVDYSKMSAVMVKAIQELNKKIEALERELAEMKDSQESGN